MLENPARATLGIIIETQITKGKPPETRQTFERLCRQGYSEEEARRMLLYALASTYYRYLFLKQPYDSTDYERALKQLPTMPWQVHGETEITEAALTEFLDTVELTVSTTENTAARYQQLRANLTSLQNAILAEVVKDGIAASATALGLMQDKTMLLGDDSEMTVVLDHAIYADPQKRARYLDAYLAAHESRDDDTVQLVEAMRNASYALLVVEGPVPELGVQVRDILHSIRYLLLDQSLAQTATPNTMIAAHVIALDGVHMTTGAPLPINDQASVAGINEIIASIPKGKTFDECNEGGKTTTRFLRRLLETGAGERVRYAEPEGLSRPKHSPPNALCPCGSGKKYKRCCGSR